MCTKDHLPWKAFRVHKSRSCIMIGLTHLKYIHPCERFETRVLHKMGTLHIKYKSLYLYSKFIHSFYVMAQKTYILSMSWHRKIWTTQDSSIICYYLPQWQVENLREQNGAKHINTSTKQNTRQLAIFYTQNYIAVLSYIPLCLRIRCLSLKWVGFCTLWRWYNWWYRAYSHGQRIWVPGQKWQQKQGLNFAMATEAIASLFGFGLDALRPLSTFSVFFTSNWPCALLLLCPVASVPPPFSIKIKRTKWT